MTTHILPGGIRVVRDEVAPSPAPEPTPSPEPTLLEKAVEAVEEVVKPKTRRGRPKKKTDAEKG